jgi:glycosyltransferase involved in cell wall biosynthesis
MSSVSIIIPVYNAAPFLKEAIQSVLSQTYRNWQLILLDDFSSDSSFEICTAFAAIDSRITAIRNDRNLGMVANWNKGIELATAELLVKLDADDFWHSEFLEKSIKIIESFPSVGLVFARWINVDEHSEIIPGTEISLPAFANEKPFSCIPLVRLGASKMLQFPILRQGVSLVRKSVIDKVGSYRQLLTPETQASADTEFYFRLGAHTELFCINEVLYYYRVHNTSISSTDRISGLQARKLYEVKFSIINYYRQLSLITQKEWLQNIRSIKFDYNVYLAYESRRKGKHLRSFQFLYYSFRVSPWVAFFFYINRLGSKLGIKETLKSMV